jgi:hypothetical protein
MARRMPDIRPMLPCQNGRRQTQSSATLRGHITRTPDRGDAGGAKVPRNARIAVPDCICEQHAGLRHEWLGPAARRRVLRRLDSRCNRDEDEEHRASDQDDIGEHGSSVCASIVRPQSDTAGSTTPLSRSATRFQARIRWPSSTNSTLTCVNRSGCLLVLPLKCAMTPVSDTIVRRWAPTHTLIDRRRRTVVHLIGDRMPHRLAQGSFPKPDQSLTLRLVVSHSGRGVVNLGGFSWRRLLGVSAAKSKISRTVGVPLTRSGRQRKIGRIFGIK